MPASRTRPPSRRVGACVGITALALAASLVAGAVPAAAGTGRTAAVTGSAGVDGSAGPGRPAGSWDGHAIEVVPGGVGERLAAAAAGPARTRTTVGYGAAAAALVRDRPRDTDRTASAQRSGREPFVDFVGNSFHDRCEARHAFDLKKLSIIDDGASDLTVLWGTCPGVTAPSGPQDAIAFIVDGGEPSGASPDLYPNAPELVLLHYTQDASYEVHDTNGSSDQADWTLVQSGQGIVNQVGPDRGGPRTVGEVAVDAVQAQWPANFYEIGVATLRGGEVGDVVPEPDMPPIAFPLSCDYFELAAARVTAPGGVAGAARVARALGARVTSVTADSFLAVPVSDEDLARLAELPGVRVRRPAAFRAAAVNDPEPTQWALDQIRLEEAWQVRARAAATIAVLDQGVDGTRRDLVGRVGAGFNAYTNELFAAGADSALGIHGTSVAGIIAGTRDNSTEIAGVNDRATLLAVTVFDHANCADDVTIAAGLDWAVANGARIANLSLGGPRDTNTLRSAVRRAADAGLLMLAATGNNGDVSPGEPNYPAAYPEVIGIGATGPTRDGLAVLAGYSQTAATEFVAPGGLNTRERDSDYAVLAEWEDIEYQAGTSFSAPVVAGLVSLWLADHPGATVAEVRDALAAASVDLPGEGDGAGLVDALALLGDQPPPAPSGVPPAPTIDGDPTTNHRLNSLDPVEAALATSKSRFPDEGSAPVVVVSRRDAFADALSGAALTAQGPLLLTDRATLDDRVGREVERVLVEGGTIYLLGGQAAISEGIEQRLRADHPGARIVRLRGQNRYETSRAIVRETVARYGPAGQTLLARGFGPLSDPNGTAAWADAIAASAFAASRRVPLLVVPTANLGPTDLAVIDEVTRPDGLVTLLGGTSALSADVLDAARTVRNARRVRGADRDETAAAIAQTLWGANPTGPRTYVVLNTHAAQGWFLGLASAGYAAEIGAPILSTRASLVPASTATLMSRCGAAQVEAWIAGSTATVGSGVVAELDRLDGSAC